MRLSDELLSVVVPVYNVEMYLEECIKSLIHQTYEYLEIILVDDGSTDLSGVICDKYQQMDHRIKVVHKRNGGLVSARKAGMKVALGQYVSFVDSDDWLELSMYEELMGVVLKERPDMISSGEIREYSSGASVFHEKTEPGIYQGNQLYEIIQRHFISTDSFFEMNISMKVTNKIFFKDLLIRCIRDIPDDISIGEDAACICPLLFQAEKICISEKAYYHYRIRESSIMGRAGTEDKDKIIRLYSYLMSRPLTLSKEMKVQYETQLKFLLLFFILLSDIPDLPNPLDKQTFWLFPDIALGSRVILCGAGRFGARLHEYLIRTEIYEVVLWADQNGKEGIAAYEDLESCDYDYIIVSALKADVVRQIKARLSEMGVNMDRVCEVQAGIIRNIEIPTVL